MRFITCGSVDDGKSTLIGRLLYDSQPDPRRPARRPRARQPPARHHRRAIRFRAPRRRAPGRARAGDHHRRGLSLLRHRAGGKFIVADTPGHEQYTRNMATGASTAATRGGAGRCAQGRAHPDAAACVYRVAPRHPRPRAGGQQDGSRRLRPRASFERDRRRSFAPSPPGSASTDVTCIPISALRRRQCDAVQARRCRGTRGPRCCRSSRRWTSPPIRRDGAFRMPVQWVNRANLDFRGYAGTVARGSVRPGAGVVALPSGRAVARRAHRARRRPISTQAVAGQSVTLTLEDEIDISRGDMLCAPADRPDGHRPGRRPSRLDA